MSTHAPPSALLTLEPGSTPFDLLYRGAEPLRAAGPRLLVTNLATSEAAGALASELGQSVAFLGLDGRGTAPDSSSLTPESPPEQLHQALQAAGEVLASGGLVWIAWHRVENFYQADPSIEALVQKLIAARDPLLVPGHLHDPCGDSSGWLTTTLPPTLVLGETLPSLSPLHLLEARRKAVEVDAWMNLRDVVLPLHQAFVASARKHPHQPGLADGREVPITRRQALIRSVVLARALVPHWEGQDHVGILLPPSVPGALCTIAAALAGRICVHLNYTLDTNALRSIAQQARLRTVVTSRRFLKRARLELPDGVRPIWLEEIAPSIGRFEKLKAAALARWAPISMLERSCGATRKSKATDPLTVIFSSGSTGEPKGVVLTHFNFATNARAVIKLLEARPDERILGILPLFHCFGYLVLWTAVNRGFLVAFHPNPLDAEELGQIIEEHRLTVLITTPTFLQLMARRCTREQLDPLRLVLTGAEKLPPTLVASMQRRFGKRPFEGYGTTECAGPVAVGDPPRRALSPSNDTCANEDGFLGHALPGVTLRVVDIESREPLLPMREGRLQIRGANLMQGYLNRDDLTQKAVCDGWYDTGDIAILDDWGRVRITDRLARFSKIGGEMVPHGRVEDELAKAWASEDRTFTVTGVPDKKRGERLIVLHTLGDEVIPGVVKKLQASGLPNLFLPRNADFFRVEELPVLGTGKLDIARVRQMASELLARTQGAARET